MMLRNDQSARHLGLQRLAANPVLCLDVAESA